MTLREVAELISAEISPEHATIEVHGPASLVEAGPGDISFFGNAKYINALRATQATAVIVPEDFSESVPPICLRAKDPAAAFAVLLDRFAPAPVEFPAGIHPSAIVAESAVVDPSAHVGAGAVIEAHATIGANAVIGAQCFIGQFVSIGADSFLHPHVTVRERCKIGQRVQIHSGAVIGSDGFGYEFRDGRHVKIPQTGIVQIDDDVEIGANTTIDRARFGRTWIQTGTKIDNLVQIAHNVRVGAHTAMAARTGIAGSTTIGKRCMIGGGVGIIGHLSICDDVILQVRSLVAQSIDKPGMYGGTLAADDAARWRRNAARFKQLDELAKRVRALERKK